MMEKEPCCPGGVCGEIPRRDFLRLTALAAVSGPVLAQAERLTRFVPVQKGRVPGLLARGERAVYRGDELRYIGMPIGGICAGQVYLGGDGRLWLWDVFNEIKLGTVPKRVEYQGATVDAGGGANYIQPPEQIHPFAQGFALKVGEDVRPLDASGWRDVAFTGEYPMGFVAYRDPAVPVTVDLEAFSPFVPLDPDDSGLPLVVMRYRVRNEGSVPVRMALGGWMENPVGLHTVRPGEAKRTNRTIGGGVEFALELPAEKSGARRAPISFEEWKAADFAGWRVEGTAFGKGPVEVGGRREVKSFRMEAGDTNLDADARTGRLTSREFTIERRFVQFWISGGNYADTLYVGLEVDGKVVRRATGLQSDALRLEHFDVREFEGRMARLVIVDEEKAFWGQITVGPIEFVDVPSQTLQDAPDFGEMALVVLGGESRAVHDLPAESTLRALFEKTGGEAIAQDTPARPRSGVVHEATLAPGAETTVSFVVAWRFPNLTISRLDKVGHHYATRFSTAYAAAEYLEKNYARLYASTKKWHATWYDSTLPRWFLDRTMANTSILATMTCVRFANGRFYGWEGIGCCDGTCGHVWQYAQAVARLFPSLERETRERVDYAPGVGFHEDTGMVDFRGEYGNGYAADAQAGYVLRTLREHQMSADEGFLKRVYPRMKMALEYLVRQDADEDGILEGRQHNTLDVDLYGPASWLSSLYLAALRAGETMAKEVGDEASARRWRAIFSRGAGRFDELFWNGSYYTHRLNLEEHPESMRIGNGCEVDQLMGQQWAHQIGLGRIVGASRAKAALRALYRNNFLPDVSTIRMTDARGRWYGLPGEPGLLMCSFPQGDRTKILGEKPVWASMYFNEVWTGQEHQVASHMIHEGLVDEGMRVLRAVHDRHHPSKRNPWNEVECSDHYARAMESYGVFVAACGYETHGPTGYLGFAPKIGAQDFRAAFTAAEGWGTYRQRLTAKGFEAGVAVHHGLVRLRTFAVETMANGKVRATVGNREVEATSRREGDRLTLAFTSEVRLKEGDELIVRVEA